MDSAMNAVDPESEPLTGRRRWLRIAGVVDLNSFRRQLVLSTAALSALVAVGLVLGVQVALAGSAVESVDRLLDDRADALISSVGTASTSTTIVVPDADIDPGVAVYDSNGELVAGYVPPHQTRAFDHLSTTDERRTGKVGDAYALVGRPFATSSGARGVVVLSERLAPYEDNESDALQVSLVAGGLLFVVATALAAWASRRALAPVAQMARTAEGWSEHDLDRRFDLGPPTNEIRALGQTLDSLLEKVERAIVAEQRLTSELAHELRTPLTAMQGTAELIAMRDDLDPQLREDVVDILDSCHRMATTVTSLLELARAQSSAHSETSCAVASVLESVKASLDLRDQVSVELEHDHRIAMPADLAVRAVSPVVDNAIRHAPHVKVSARQVGSRVVIRVRDDGPGVDRRDADRIFRAGQTVGTGSGLGLALARRIARTAGGDVTLATGADDPHHPAAGGATFDIALPALQGAVPAET